MVDLAPSKEELDLATKYAKRALAIWSTFHDYWSLPLDSEWAPVVARLAAEAFRAMNGALDAREQEELKGELFAKRMHDAMEGMFQEMRRNMERTPEQHEIERISLLMLRQHAKEHGVDLGEGPPTTEQLVRLFDQVGRPPGDRGCHFIYPDGKRCGNARSAHPVETERPGWSHEWVP